MLYVYIPYLNLIQNLYYKLGAIYGQRWLRGFEVLNSYLIPLLISRRRVKTMILKRG